MKMTAARLLFVWIAIILLASSIVVNAQTNDSLRERILAEIARRTNRPAPTRSSGSTPESLANRLAGSGSRRRYQPAPIIEEPTSAPSPRLDSRSAPPPPPAQPSSPRSPTRETPRTPPPTPASPSRQPGEYVPPHVSAASPLPGAVGGAAAAGAATAPQPITAPVQPSSPRAPAPTPTPPAETRSSCGANEYIKSLSDDDGVFVSLSMLLGDICASDPELCADTEQGRIDRGEVFDYVRMHFPYHSVSFEVNRDVEKWIDKEVDEDSHDDDDDHDHDDSSDDAYYRHGHPSRLPTRRRSPPPIDETERLKMVYLNISEMEADAVERRLLEAIEEHNRRYPNQPPFMPPKRHELTGQLDTQCLEEAFNTLLLRVGKDNRTIEEKRKIMRSHLQDQVKIQIENMVTAIQDAAKKLSEEAPKLQDKAMTHIDRYLDYFQTYPPAISHFMERLLNTLHEQQIEHEEKQRLESQPSPVRT